MAAVGRAPNIVFLLADDLGWGDLSCYNPQSKIKTPHLDRMAAQGLRFTDAHTPSSVCTPTRYGLLTGRYSWRTRLKSGVQDGFDPPLIEKGRMTVASMLKQRGYVTGCFGKWHLGMTWTRKDGTPMPFRASGGFRPGDDVDFSKPVTDGVNAAGFDEYFGISASLDMPPYCFLENDRPAKMPVTRMPKGMDLFLNQPEGVASEGFRLEDVMPEVTKRAVSFVSRNASKPFFLYVPFSSPHLPVVPNAAYAGKSGAGKYGDFVVEMDDCVGAILGALDKAGVAGNTLVCFSSDNGGLWHWWDFMERDDVQGGKMTPRGAYNKDYGHQSNAWMRGTKADAWEGGHRVPFLARWPGKIKAGGVSEAVVCLTDFMATCAEVVGQRLPADAGEDSFSLMPVFTGAKKEVRDHVVHHTLQGKFAIRMGEWKLIVERGSGGFSAPRTVDGEPVGQLYNLRTDRAETKNVYAENPQVVARLRVKLEAVQRNGGS
ncbi:MAG: arylsulfatase [Acidobacteria bacterium]|nr:arylsulfatase [Acidobacteriota bacterium]